jgi:hypothetical protein
MRRSYEYSCVEQYFCYGVCVEQYFCYGICVDSSVMVYVNNLLLLYSCVLLLYSSYVCIAFLCRWMQPWNKLQKMGTKDYTF